MKCYNLKSNFVMKKIKTKGKEKLTVLLITKSISLVLFCVLSPSKGNNFLYFCFAPIHIFLYNICFLLLFQSAKGTFFLSFFAFPNKRIIKSSLIEKVE